MAKNRSDSLYSRLTPEQRDELLVFLVELGGGYIGALKMLEPWGVKASLSSLSRFVDANGLDWRLKRAVQKAADAEGKLPKEWEKAKRVAMQQKEFELSLRDLTLSEFETLERLELDKQKAAFEGKIKTKRLTLDVSKFQMKSCELFAKWYGHEKSREIMESKLSNSDKIAKLRQTFFKDVDDLAASGKVVLPA